MDRTTSLFPLLSPVQKMIKSSVAKFREGTRDFWTETAPSIKSKNKKICSGCGQSRCRC